MIRKSWLICSVVTLTFCSTVLSSSAGAAPQLGAEYERSAAEAFADHFGISVTDAQSVLDQQQKAAGLSEAIGERYPEYYGGMSSKDALSHFEIYITSEKIASDIAAIAASSGVKDVSTQLAHFSLKELEEATIPYCGRDSAEND